MPVWLRKSFGEQNYEEAFNRLEQLWMTKGLHQDVLMIADNEGSGPPDVVFIWLSDEVHAQLFPEFEISERPQSSKPLLLIGEWEIYEKQFPRRH